MASVQSSFLDDLSWLMCTFCAENFSRRKQFMFLFCSKVACIDCALQMRSQSDRNKVDCNMCKKTVGLCPIRDDMPPQIRKMFQNTFKMIDETMRIWDFQEHLNTMAIDNLDAKVEWVEGEITEAAFRAQEDEQATQKYEAETARYAAELEKVIAPEELQRFERLSVQELQQMSFDELVGSSFRSRSSRTSSRPSSRHSCASRALTPDRACESIDLTQMMHEMDVTPQHRIQSLRHGSTPDSGSLSGFHSYRDVPQMIQHRQGSRERHSRERNSRERHSRDRNSRNSRNSRQSYGHARSPGRGPRQSNESRRRSSREVRPHENWQN